MYWKISLVCISFLLSACACTSSRRSYDYDAEKVVYTPITPIPIVIEPQAGVNNEKLLSALKNEASRFSIGEVGSRGEVTWKPLSIAVEGNQYKAVLDYIKYTTRHVGFDTLTDDIYDLTPVTRNRRSALEYSHPEVSSVDFIVPVNIGIGFRMTVEFNVSRGGFKISHLFDLESAAEGQNITGKFFIQTLGISGRSISPLIPLPGKIDGDTITNVLQSLEELKSHIYDGDEQVDIEPKIVSIERNTVDEYYFDDFLDELLLSKLTLDLPND